MEKSSASECTVWTTRSERSHMIVRVGSYVHEKNQSHSYILLVDEIAQSDAEPNTVLIKWGISSENALLHKVCLPMYTQPNLPPLQMGV